ncbi:NAD(P)-dependent oxidoreductase [Microlunatus parietis]|uniref:3-hydroxyisobutyrate dehydrogenase-like beta-hydroxyacid dehydrogenase n=1 Tax=Microlunatus parietis TaxID=682979 RepID=A0A7Y9IAY0_9ACTN|nr:NAD(P)-dependent oxidoreductase [Microlunatus parietis]NYE73479.1 3-hydroxyisobutyrate dehydrogenase-like beta-hydroxyacid dehydrogenase [Microlunatus parietis]
MEPVGLIGLGNVGGRMARSLLDAGVELHVHDVDQEASAAVREAGAVGHDTASDLARAVPIVLLSLPNADIVDRVVLGPGGVLEAMAAGSILVDMSTNRPDRTLALLARATERAVRTLDAPISFGGRGMIVFAGGDPADYAEVAPIFDVVAFRHYHVGDHGQGQYVKLIQNLLSGIAIGAAAEAVAFGQRAGVDLDRMLEALRWTGAYSGALAGSRRMVDRDYGSSRTLGMHVKDLGYVLAMAEQLGATMPFAERVHDVFRGVYENGDPGWTQAAVIEWFDPVTPASAP